MCILLFIRFLFHHSLSEGEEEEKVKTTVL
jgi:hypothetical protein